MYGRFADAEMLCGSADGTLMLDDVHSQLTGSLFDVFPHVSNPLRCVCQNNLCAAAEEYTWAAQEALYKKCKICYNITILTEKEVIV